MKNRVPKCFRLQSQTMSNDGQVGFMKIDFAEIPRSRKASAAMGTR